MHFILNSEHATVNPKKVYQSYANKSIFKGVKPRKHGIRKKQSHKHILTMSKSFKMGFSWNHYVWRSNPRCLLPHSVKTNASDFDFNALIRYIGGSNI